MSQAAKTRSGHRSRPTVRLRPPPPALMRVVNPLVRRVLTSPVTGNRIGTVVIVEAQGRRSGRLLRIPMGLHDVDGTPTAFTCRAWRLNFAGGAPVTVVRRGRRVPAQAVLVAPAPGQVGAALQSALEHGASPFDLGLRIPRRHRPTVADLDGAGLSMIQFHLAPAEEESS